MNGDKVSCAECRDLLPLYIVGGLEPVEMEKARRHLAAGCPVCEGELAALESAFHSIPEALGRVEAPLGRAWEKIDERMALQKRAERRSRTVIPPQWLGWAVAAAAVIVMAILLGQERQTTSRVLGLLGEQHQRMLADSLASTAARSAQDLRISELNLQLADVRTSDAALQASLKNSQQEMARRLNDLATATEYAMGAGIQSPRAKLFWNKDAGTWTLVASGVKSLPAGKTYELWAINDRGDKVAAGTFEPDKEGRALFEARLPADAGNVVTAAVTDEPAGGVKAPTGSIQFAGKL